MPLYESYYAGLAGRSEIIAHGTTIDPHYYAGKPYYPLTPTEGCLCTKEIWNGKRISSDQQKLVNGLLKAGGANGYCVVIEIDDKNAPVTLNDVLLIFPNERIINFKFVRRIEFCQISSIFLFINSLFTIHH